MVVGGRELIDTLWNVNEGFPVILKQTNGINRYIMECKLCRGYQWIYFFLELIDTLWNVNNESFGAVFRLLKN